MRRSWLLPALLGVGLVLGAAPALADPGDDAVLSTGEVTLTFNSSVAGYAYCDHGATAIGGGVGTVDPPPLNMSVNVSAPLDKTEVPGQTRSGDTPKEWYASMYSGEGSDETVRVFAICSKSAKAKLKVKSFKVKPVGTTSATVACPKGQRALSGGMDIATAPQDGLYEVASGPLGKRGGSGAVKSGDSPRRWQVAVYNGYDVSRRYRAMVICSAQVQPQIEVTKTSVDSNQTQEDTAACPGGTRAFGGGVLPLGQLTPQLELEQSTPLDVDGTVTASSDGDVPVFWDAALYNRTAKPRDFKVLAVCG
jgi:hypothetical protein